MTELSENEAKELVFAEIDAESEYNFEEITPRYYISESDDTRLESICGIDNRIKVTATSIMPYKAICKLYMQTRTGKNYIGSGWLTHQNKLYTAGHCVFAGDEEAVGCNQLSWFRGCRV